MFVQRTIGFIITKHMRTPERMPKDLRERLDNQLKALGSTALGTLLTSGEGISRLGFAVRDILAGTGKLRIQRAQGFRPIIERMLDFYSRVIKDAGGLVVSGMTPTHQLGGQVRNFFSKITNLRKGNLGEKAEGVYDFISNAISGGEFIRGCFALAYVLGLWTIGVGAATKNYFVDKIALRKQAQKPPKKKSGPAATVALI